MLHSADEPVRTAVMLEVLEGAGVAAPATRATLDRMVARGMLSRSRRGRELEFTLTEQARGVLSEGGERVNEAAPFEPHGAGWTLVTFTVPERQRSLRNRLRALLTWEGFAPLRDGLWLAPGAVDLVSKLEPLRADLADAAVTAFRAHELDGFSVGPSVADAWDIAAIRREHEQFLDVWSADGATDGAAGPLSALTMLVADWLALLRADPRLPAQYMDADWPADRSLAVYRARHAELAAPASAAFAGLVGERAAV